MLVIDRQKIIIRTYVKACSFCSQAQLDKDVKIDTFMHTAKTAIIKSVQE